MNARLQEIENGWPGEASPGLGLRHAESSFDDQKWAEALLAGEKRVLEMIARGKSLPLILDALCRLIEQMSSGSFCSILLLDEGGEHFRHGAAPSLPSSYTERINGHAISSCWGPSGIAAYRKEQVVISDVATDPVRPEYRDLALEHGLRACWSMPILSSEGGVLGTFGIYSHDKRCPAPQDYRVIEQVSHLASVAIERKHAEDALRRSEAALRASEQLARGQVTALTRTLDALAMESAPDRLVEHVLRTITDQLDAHSCSVWRKEDASNLVSFEFAFEKDRLVTRSDAAIAKISPTLNVDDVWPWPEVFRTGRPSVMEDIREGPSFPWREHVLALGVITILVVPMLIAGRVEGVIGIRFTRKRSFRAEEMELAQALAHQAMLAIQLRRLSRQSREAAVAAERNRLARDIHDTLAQGLTGVIVQLEAGEDALSKGLTLEAGNHLDQAGKLARESLQEARRSVQALRPQSLEEKELPGALADLFKKMTTGTSISAAFVQRGESCKLPQDWEENLLRIGQEVLTNALRHAQATEFKAALVFEPGAIRFDMQDNGRGFDPGNRHDGFGLMGISERVEGMGGQFKIESRTGEGTEILISLPFSAEHQTQSP